MKRRGESAWTLHRDDLPPEWVVERAPKLAGVEENVFFRTLAMQRRLGRRGVGDAAKGSVSPLLIVALILLLGCLAVPILIYLLATGRVRSSRSGLQALLLRRNPIMHDLLQAGLDPGDAAIGLWGYMVSQRQLRWETNAYYGLAVLIVGLAILWPTFRVWVPESVYILWPLSSIGIFILAALVAARRGRAQIALKGQARKIRSLVKSIDSRRNAGALILKGLSLIALVVILFVILWTALALLAYLGALWIVGAKWLASLLGVDLLGAIAFIFWSVLSLSAGFALGRAFSRAAIRSEDDNLESMTRNLKRIFEWIAAREEAEIQRKAER
jgi:hypothetical protein